MNEPDITTAAREETAVSTAQQPENEPAATLSERMILFILALFVIGLDQYTKFLVESNLALFEVYAPIPSLESVFRFFHIYNTGATFGLFEGGGDIFRYLAIVVSLGIIYYNFILPGNHRLLRLALGLQMGGALGNMIDRFRLGHVTDFIDIGPWYIFNLADLAVVSGAVILGFMVWQESRELKAQQQAEQNQGDLLETAVPHKLTPAMNKIQTLQLDAPGQRLDKVLAEQLPDLSRTQIQRLLKEEQILVNGRSAKANLRLEGGEQVIITLPEPEETELLAEAIPLDIRYEDDDMLVINKPAGMVVHPAVGHASGTLVNAILAHCPNLPGIGGEKRPGIVHRLDKETSGLIVVAKNEVALRHLQAQFKERTVGKQYLALVEGQVQPPTALIDAPLGRDPRQRKKMAVIPFGSSARSRTAQTQYDTITGYDDYTLLRCELFTGRTHQIRVHLAYIGFPIVGDKVYGRRKPSIHLGRQFLHAAVLRVKRPSDNGELTFHAELPPELEAVLQQLAK